MKEKEAELKRVMEEVERAREAAALAKSESVTMTAGAVILNTHSSC